MLGLSPGAPPEQVERAYRFYRDLYRDNSLATYSLLSPQELLGARTRVQEAYEVLADPARRSSYDVSLGLPVPESAAPSPPAAGPFPALVPEPAPTAVPSELAAAPEPAVEPAQATEPIPAVRPPLAPVPPPEPPPLPDPVTGAALKAHRVAQGVSLRDIANQSKIGVRFLEYLEADRFHDLPAPVYIRGFLREYARACGLDAQHIVDSYLSRLGKT
ncbi:MAG TPA: helix-turn-helix domain-containing protein [Vicinamibacteria bacterium]|nr:helix-turn-helix domain-containing protein [Vicinamibacteria bacterium]